MRFWQRFGKDRRGSALIMGALLMVIIVGLAAFAVDVGYLYLKSRELQGTADLAAMLAAASPLSANARAEAVVMANNGSAEGIKIKIETGTYDAAAGLSPEARFTQAPAASANAVRVTLQEEGELFFGRMLVGDKKAVITRTATASSVKMAAFSIGTRLASVNGGIANALLSGLTGSQINLSVMDYNALAGAKIDLLSYVQALHTRANITAGTYDQALASDITVGDALKILADQAGDKAAPSLSKLTVGSVKTTKIKLSDLVDIGAYGAQDSISGGADSAIAVDSLTLTKAILELANTNRQVALDLGTQVPGLAGLKVWLAIGERPNHSAWLTVTNKGEPVIRTAQTRLYVDASLLPGLAGVSVVHLPLYVELASAQAKLSTITCHANASLNRVDLAVSPSIGQINIGTINLNDLNNFKKTLVVGDAALVNLPLIGTVTARSEIKLGGESWQTVSFQEADIRNNVIKTARTNDAVQSIAASLVSHMTLKAQILGLGIGLGAITTTLGQVLSTAAPLLDPVLNSLLDTLGIGLGEVDAQVNGLRCSGAALVI
ncbi:MAG: pilus assembly protein TadG-related protein [Asticcacaulis sp.]